MNFFFCFEFNAMQMFLIIDVIESNKRSWHIL
jgi:hypothetical protein